LYLSHIVISINIKPTKLKILTAIAKGNIGLILFISGNGQKKTSAVIAEVLKRLKCKLFQRRFKAFRIPVIVEFHIACSSFA